MRWRNAARRSLPSSRSLGKTGLCKRASGVDMSTFRGATENIRIGTSQFRVALRAYELWSWVSSRFADRVGGHPTTTIRPRRGETGVANQLMGREGIVLIRDFWGSGQGHIDLWNGSKLGSGVSFGPNSYFDRAREIIFLDLTRSIIHIPRR